MCVRTVLSRGRDRDGDRDRKRDDHAAPHADRPRTRSLRNINTIIAFRQDGSGVEWYLSANAVNVTGIPSNFTFDNDDSKFYNVHEAQLIDEDSLILMDDGNNRPGCKAPEGENCFSRALEYHLDFEKMEATLVWQASGFPRQTSNIKRWRLRPPAHSHQYTRWPNLLQVAKFILATQSPGKSG